VILEHAKETDILIEKSDEEEGGNGPTEEGDGNQAVPATIVARPPVKRIVNPYDEFLKEQEKIL